MIGYNPWFLPENFNGRLLNFFLGTRGSSASSSCRWWLPRVCLFYFRAHIT